MRDWTAVGTSWYRPLCGTSLENITTVDDNGLSVDVLVGGNKEHTVTHVAVVTRSGSRNLALKVLLWKLALLVRTRLTLGHLGWEDTWCNAVDTDLETVVGNLPAKHLGEVDDGSLGSVVGKVVLGGLDDTGDGADVDYTSGVSVLVLGSGLEEWEEGGGHEVALWDARGVC